MDCKITQRVVDLKQPPRGVLGKGFLKICSKFTGEHPCQTAVSIKLHSNIIETALWHGCSSVNLLHIFRTPFLKNTSARLLLELIISGNTSKKELRYQVSKYNGVPHSWSGANKVSLCCCL